MITLRGSTWAHTRGYLPMVATAQRYEELHPGVRIVWEKRSLDDFAQFPIQDLAARYDLMVIDHPFIGYAARHRTFLRLDDYLSAAFLRDQAENSVGASHLSYNYEGSQWALAIDAATPVAAWRADILARAGLAVPTTWAEVLALARAGRVEVPGDPINCLMNFFGLCVDAGETPFTTPRRVVGPEAGHQALAWLRELHALCAPSAMARNPIHSLNLLASAANTEVAYCLFPYGYSNYSREGYAERTLTFGDLPAMRPGGRPLTTTLGGTGLAISATTAHAALAADYAQYVASAEVQRTLYTHQAGGQPGHRSAWLDAENNRATLDYFRSTLPALDRAYVRPRYAGYLHGFQDLAGPLVHRHLTGQLSAADTLTALDKLAVSSPELV
jgi:multiple sugar transport system substrate-binding protein